MIFPISHEDQRGRRWPYVTIAIILLNFGIFLFTNAAMDEQNDRYGEKAQEAFEYYVSHPHLTPPPALQPMLDRLGKASRKDKILVESMKALQESADDARGGVDEETKREQQKELEALCEAMVAAKKESPLLRYAYVPAESNVTALFTSQFLHGGWLHVIFNMWFLWLAGCNIEDRWGRLVFPLFYLSAGAVAALGHKLSEPQSMIPLVGASGAIAGAMGAFLVKFATTKIQFVLLWFRFMIPRATTFSAPAFIMLPLWLASQVWNGLMYQSIGGAGVAWWAHVGGFVFGAVFAVVMTKSGLEARLDQAIEGRISLKADPAVVKASDLIDEGKAPEAIDLLEKFAQQQPANIDAQLQLLRAAKAVPDPARETRTYIRLIGLYMQQEGASTALDLYEEMQQLGTDTSVPAPLRLRIAKHLEKSNFLEGAAQEYCNIYSNGQADATSFQALLAHAQLALRTQKKDEAVQLFTLARNSPVPHLDWDTVIDHGLKKANELPGTPPAQTKTAGQ